LLLEKRFESIRETAAHDIEKSPPPKEYWLDDKLLEAWLEEREWLRKGQYA
jgi:hypothetical protein